MTNGKAITPEIMKDRTKQFAKQIIYLCRKLPKNREGYLIGNQIFRSGTSVASNYRAACRGRSEKGSKVMLQIDHFKLIRNLQSAIRNLQSAICNP